MFHHQLEPGTSSVSPAILPIESLKESALRVWREPVSPSPGAGTTYSIPEQVRKELEVDGLMDAANGIGANLRDLRGRRSKRLIAIRSRIQRSIIQLLHSFDCPIDGEMEGSFSRVTDEFIHRAFDFDPGITDEAVYQASRNVLIMNTFQMHLGREVSLSPSVFAYSMLYPYTDNYLDSVEIDRESKRDTNNRMHVRLAGILTRPRNHHDRMIDRLVTMIEGEFDRRKYPLVYQSLLAIHSAQCRSVEQQGAECRLSIPDLLDISIEKGGTSVLADGYLVAGEPSDEDVEFFFHFGMLLQLIDDLQDLEEDLSRHQWTLAGAQAQAGCLNGYTDRLLALIPVILGSSRLEGTPLRQLIDRSCRLLILEAAATHTDVYSTEYLSRLERHSPVRFVYLRSIRARMRDTCDTHRREASRALPLVG